jgi:leucyl-tRNA synthetase
MNEQYDFEVIELKQQARWKEEAVYKAEPDSTKEKFFCLAMLPYPSGHLHMGHVRNYTLSDVIARYQRMLGKNVLQPMGWDAFGLPAENAAIKHKTPPSKWTYENIAHMKTQFERLGFAYDWDREIATCSPDYYRWEQWFFIQLYKKDLVYRKSSLVNWDPVDQTVLANEQVIDGRGWRSGALVEQREIPQWFLKITNYADELLNDLDGLDWPEEVKTMQRNWIGKSEGLEIQFTVIARSVSDEAIQSAPKGLEYLDLDCHAATRLAMTVLIYTTRPDTLAGCTYLAIAAKHPLAKKAAETNSELAKFLEACSQHGVAEATIATLEKEGMDTGLRVLNPLTGKELPVWVANFVLMEYGTGAVMCVPAHDERDHEFAQKYKLPMTVVITSENWDYTKFAFTEKGPTINSGALNGLEYAEAFDVVEKTLGSAAKRKINFRLRDWGVSRQRYWGTPIPMIHCPSCGIVPVAEKDLPVILPEDFTPDGSQSPLKKIASFYETSCPECKGLAHRETDTFDTFMESSWYYARYTCPKQNEKMLDEEANYWLPADQYVGGIEHAVMHLLYSRFFHKLLRDFGLLKSDEPFTRLLTQGMVLKEGAKMSKSKGNVVDPQMLINKYGADTVRLFMIFATSPELSLEWSDAGVEGAYKFLKRVWSLAYELHVGAPLVGARGQPQGLPLQSQSTIQNIRRQMHQILQKANFDMERQQFNTVVSAAMKLMNLLQEIPVTENPLIEEGLRIVLCLLAPITPHLCCELWKNLGYGDDILKAVWPQVDEQALQTDTVDFVIQVNGKLRANIQVSISNTQAEIEEMALIHPKVQSYILDKTVRKVIIVPGKLVNIVAG